jgi:hypothetical protein
MRAVVVEQKDIGAPTLELQDLCLMYRSAKNVQYLLAYWLAEIDWQTQCPR